MTRALAQKSKRANHRAGLQQIDWSQDDVGHLVLHHVSWEGYEHLLKKIGDRQLRLTYDNGALEIIYHLDKHETPKKIIARLVEALTEELSIPCMGGGATTFRSRAKAKGLEPDECYYFGPHATPAYWKNRRRKSADADLAIEIDYTTRSIPRLPIYAKLGIPEVWRLQGEQLHCLRLSKSGAYEEVKFSVALSTLQPGELTRFIEMAEESCDQTSTMKAFWKWVRKQGWGK